DIAFIDQGVTLKFSQDTVLFDTLFTTIGSSTAWLKVKNPEKKPVLIDRIYLAGGTASNFRINIDGEAATVVKDFRLDGGDSIFIFVEVTVDPNNSNNPMVIADSVVFENKGTVQSVHLVAWGQDAHFIVADKSIGSLQYKIVAGENENITWTNDKPYVIYGYAVIDSAGQLNINPGTQIHFHNNSGMWVYIDGCLKVNGTKDDPVTFQGDRPEGYYKDIPGQWDRIWINQGSRDSEINYAVIRNGFIGIQAEKLGSQSYSNKLVLNNTIIENMSGRGIFTKSYNIEATNCLIANTGEISVYLSAGGSYDFRHTTIANYWPYETRQIPSVVVSNYYFDAANNIVYSGDLVKAYFGNSIIYGSNKEEFAMANEHGGLFNYTLDHCFIKTSLNPADYPLDWLNCMTRNSDLPGYNPNEPLFVDAPNGTFELDSLAPVVDYGSLQIINNAPVSPASIIQHDIKGNSRISDIAPDLGVFEFVPGQ
ncbi:MAG: hypothetical protein RQ866_07695, partial [Bacteroidales bacterium]|nr:hypothetical protein [Bacteroidales bacterium]